MIGKYFRPKKNFKCEEFIFNRYNEYKLVDIMDVGSYTLYLFEGGNIYGEYDNGIEKFRDIFSTIQEDRIKIVNKLLYED